MQLLEGEQRTVRHVSVCSYRAPRDIATYAYAYAYVSLGVN